MGGRRLWGSGRNGQGMQAEGSPGSARLALLLLLLLLLSGSSVSPCPLQLGRTPAASSLAHTCPAPRPSAGETWPSWSPLPSPQACRGMAALPVLLLLPLTQSITCSMTAPPTWCDVRATTKATCHQNFPFHGDERPPVRPRNLEQGVRLPGSVLLFLWFFSPSFALLTLAGRVRIQEMWKGGETAPLTPPLLFQEEKDSKDDHLLPSPPPSVLQ